MPEPLDPVQLDPVPDATVAPAVTTSAGRPMLFAQATDTSEVYRTTRELQRRTESPIRQLVQAEELKASQRAVAPAAPADKHDEAAMAPPKPSSPEGLGATLQDVGTQAAYGVAQAGIDTARAVDALALWLNRNTRGAFGMNPEDAKGNPWVGGLTDMPAAKSLPGGLVRGFTQLATEMLPWLKVAGAAKAATISRVGAGKLGHAAGNVVEGLVATAVPTAREAVFEDTDARFSNLINELAAKYPALKNPITTYLAADPNDARATAALKSALENVAIGMPIDALFGLIGGWRAVRKAAAMGQKIEGARLKAERAGGAPAPDSPAPVPAPGAEATGARSVLDDAADLMGQGPEPPILTRRQDVAETLRAAARLGSAEAEGPALDLGTVGRDRAFRAKVAAAKDPYERIGLLIEDAHAREGGSTFDLKTGLPVKPEGEWYMVALPRSKPFLRAPIAAEIAPLVREWEPLIESTGGLVKVGTYFSEDAGRHFVELSMMTPDRALAERLGKAFKEESIWSGHTKEALKIGEPAVGKMDLTDADILAIVRDVQAGRTPNMPFQPLRDFEARYAAERGIDLPERTVGAVVDEDAAMRRADRFDAMAHAPDDPKVQRAYGKMKEDILAQAGALQREGYVLEPWRGEGQPYASSAEMMADVRERKHLYIFTGGDLPANHPLAELVPNGGGLTYNDVFRWVHDILGHAMEGVQFGPIGEERAWLAHSRLFSPEARLAMTTETRGQNSWVNYGRHLRTPEGDLPRPGDPGYLPPPQRQYAEQKAGLLPIEDAGLRPEDVPDFLPEVKAGLKPGLVARVLQAIGLDSERGSIVPGMVRGDIADTIRKNSETWNDLRAIGAAKIYGGARSYADFSESMLREFGDPIQPHLPDLFTAAHKTLSDQITARVKDGLPSTETLLGLFQKGEFGKEWYDKAFTEILKIFKGSRADAELFVDVLAATSPNSEVRANIVFAFRAFDRIRRGADVAGRRHEKTFMDSHLDNLQLVQQHFERGGYEQGVPLTISGPKVGPFAAALRGDAQAVVLDTWMMRAFGFQHLTGATTKRGLPGWAGPKAPSIAASRFMTQIVRDEAAKLGVTPRQYQAALWVGIKLASEGDKAYIAAIDDAIRARAERFGPKLTKLFPALKGSELGSVHPATVLFLTRAIAGAALGGQVGDTDEEKWRNAFLGAGLSSVGGRLLWKSVKPLLKDSWLDQQRGAIAPHRTPELVTASDLDQVRTRYQADVEAQRRGTRSHEQAQADADLLKVAGMTLDDVRAILPGTAMNDAEAIAVVKHLVDSGDRLLALSKRVAAGEPDALDDFLQQLYVHAQIDPKRLGVLAESGRTLSAMNDPTSGMNTFLRQFENLFANQHAGMTPERLAAMVASFKTPQQLAVFARQAAKPGMGDMVMEAWINGLLSGPKTWAANLLGNTAAAAWALPERYLAEKFGAGVAPGETGALLHGAVGGILDLWSMAAKAFQEDGLWAAVREPIEQARAEAGAVLSKTEHKPAITSENLELTGVVGRAVDLLGSVVRIPGAILDSSDQVFKLVNYRAELRARAWRDAYTTATSEGLSGKKAVTRANAVYTAILADPPSSLKARAQEYAALQTFTRALGEHGQGLQQFLNHPIGRIVVPFVRTPINLFKYVYQRTPIGFFSDEVRAAIGRGGADRDLALAQIALGSTTMAVFGALAASGYIEGGGPSDKTLRDMKRNAGWIPYSINVGKLRGGQDSWVAFNRLEPIGMLMGLGADMGSILGSVESIEGEELAASVVMAVAKNVTSKTFIKGVAETLGALTHPDEAGERYIQSLAGSVVPGAVRTLEQAVDPTLREARSMVDAMRQHLPGLSDSLPPRRNVWGQPIEMPAGMGPDWLSPVFVSRGTNDPVSKAVADNQIKLDRPDRQVQRVPLTEAEYDRYVVLAGEPLHQALGKIVQSPEWKTWSRERRDLTVRTMATAYREAAQGKLIQEFPDLKAAIIDTTRAEREKLRAAPPVGF